jgi:hypothetical protein
VVPGDSLIAECAIYPLCAHAPTPFADYAPRMPPCARPYARSLLGVRPYSRCYLKLLTEPSSRSLLLAARNN